MGRQGDDDYDPSTARARSSGGYNPPAGGAAPQPPPQTPAAPAAPAAPQGYQGERRDDSSVGEKDWDPNWEKRVHKKLPGEKGDLNDPKYRDYLNRKLKKMRKGGGQPKPVPGGTEPGDGSGVPTGGVDPPPTGGVDPPPTGGVDPPPTGGGGPVNPVGGWMPNQAALPWGGGGRVNWGQGPAPSQGYPGGGAGYPGAPNYPVPGQSSPLPGYPGGPVSTNPGQPNPSTAGGYPDMPPAGHGYPKWPQNGLEDRQAPGGNVDPTQYPQAGGGAGDSKQESYETGRQPGPQQPKTGDFEIRRGEYKVDPGDWEKQAPGAPGPVSPLQEGYETGRQPGPQQPNTGGGPRRLGPGETPPPGRGYPRWPGGRAPEWGPRRPWGSGQRQVDPMAAYQATQGRTF